VSLAVKLLSWAVGLALLALVGIAALLFWANTESGRAAGKRAAFAENVERYCDDSMLMANNGAQRMMAKNMCEDLRKEARKR